MAVAHVNGIDLYYEEHGPEGAEPLLLIMGFASNAGAWAPQIPALAARFRVIAFDNRGCGRSSQPEGPYTIPQMADDAVALLDMMGIGSAHVVGASMGGMIAQELALRHPARVRSLVLLCTTSGGPHAGLQEAMLEMFTPEFLAKPTPEFIAFAAAAAQHPATLAGLKGQLAAVREHDTYDRLRGIAVPTLVMAGSDDPMVDAANAPILAQRIPGAQLRMFAGLRHGFTAERPDEVNAAILEFLAQRAHAAA
jgi:3-oxoadipate enol-lactonase